MPKDEYDALTDEAKKRAFTVAGTAQLDLIASVQNALASALEQGTDLEAFKAAVGEKLQSEWVGSKGNPASRLETIFRTNVQSAYNAGRHAEATDPDTLAMRPYWQFDAVVDSRTTSICKGANGVVLPASDPWWSRNIPPRHFNAVTSETVILTDRGEVRAADVRPGMMVLTHKRRWRRVTMALHKRVTDKPIRSIHLDSGRVLRVTHEHPILRAPSLDWIQAEGVQVGDVLFEHADESAGVSGCAVGNAEDAPSLADDPGVALGIADGSDPRPVVLSVHLDGYLQIHERYVDDERPDGVLSDGAEGFKHVEDRALWWCQVLPGMVGHRVACADSNGVTAHRVINTHSLGTLGAAQAVCPVTLTSGAVGVELAVGDRSLLRACAHQDAEGDAPSGQGAVGKPCLTLKGTDAAALAPVLPLNECGQAGGGAHVFHTSTVISIVEGSFSGEVCDFSVEDDETYVADGIVVHNCRSTFHPLTRRQAAAAGIATESPPVNAAEGFGAPPT